MAPKTRAAAKTAATKANNEDSIPELKGVKDIERHRNRIQKARSNARRQIHASLVAKLREIQAQADEVVQKENEALIKLRKTQVEKLVRALDRRAEKRQQLIECAEELQRETYGLLERFKLALKFMAGET